MFAVFLIDTPVAAGQIHRAEGTCYCRIASHEPPRRTRPRCLCVCRPFRVGDTASKLLLAELPPFQLAGLLYLGAALAMLPMVTRRPNLRLAQLDSVNRRRLLGAVVADGLVAPVLLLAGLRLAPAGSVSLLLNLEMAATAVLGALVFREPLARIGWVGVAGIVAAGALLSGGDWPGIAAALFVAAACLWWGLDNHFTALIDGITPAVSTFWKGAVAGSVNLAIGVATAPLTATWGEIAAALATGALAYGLSIALYIRAAQQLGACGPRPCSPALPSSARGCPMRSSPNRFIHRRSARPRYSWDLPGSCSAVYMRICTDIRRSSTCTATGTTTITTNTNTRIEAPRRAIHTRTGTMRSCTRIRIGRISTTVTITEAHASVVPPLPPRSRRAAHRPRMESWDEPTHARSVVAITIPEFGLQEPVLDVGLPAYAQQVHGPQREEDYVQGGKCTTEPECKIPRVRGVAYESEWTCHDEFMVK